MAVLQIKTGAWVVVCDGAKSIVLENIGDAARPDLRTRQVAAQPAPPARDLGAAGPGRAFSPAGSRRSSMEETDFHEQAEHDFLTALAGELDRAVVAGEAKGLVVVAPPRALGVLRKAWSKRVRDALIAEIDKDLVAHPVNEIERHLFGRRKPG